MSILIGGGIAAIVLVGYVGRKSWLAFHRMAGISPGTLIYADPARLSPPPMIQLQLSDEQLHELPPLLLEQIQRIDTKADIYQSWQNDLRQSGQTPVTSEDEFVLHKLLTIRLPEMLNSYQRIVRHDNRLKDAVLGHSTRHNDAAVLLIDLLYNIETKLDNVLQDCKNESLQDLQVMRHYLDNR